MEIIAYCNNSCCPSIIINEKDRSQPILIKDDYDGAIALPLKDFDTISKYVTNLRQIHLFPQTISDRDFKIFAYRTDKTYLEISTSDALGNNVSVKDISFDHWAVFAEAIAEHYAVA